MVLSNNKINNYLFEIICNGNYFLQNEHFWFFSVERKYIVQMESESEVDFQQYLETIATQTNQDYV